MLTNIDINKMNHLLETNEDARQIITQLLKSSGSCLPDLSRNTKSTYFNFFLSTDNGTGTS